MQIDELQPFIQAAVQLRKIERFFCICLCDRQVCQQVDPVACVIGRALVIQVDQGNLLRIAADASLPSYMALMASASLTWLWRMVMSCTGVSWNGSITGQVLPVGREKGNKLEYPSRGYSWLYNDAFRLPSRLHKMKADCRYSL